MIRGSRSGRPLERRGFAVEVVRAAAAVFFGTAAAFAAAAVFGATFFATTFFAAALGFFRSGTGVAGSPFPRRAGRGASVLMLRVAMVVC
jgi:hypothetical protein